MEKSLGNKRRRIGDPSEERTAKDPDHIADIARIHGAFENGTERTFTEEDPITHKPVDRPRVVSRLFDNEDFGYRKITVERPLRLNFQAVAERIARIEDQPGFKNLATSNKKAEEARQKEIEAGRSRQREIRQLLRELAKATEGKPFKDRPSFLGELRAAEKQTGIRLEAAESKAVLAALSERDETAEICRSKDGKAEPDPELRDTESVPLKEDIHAYFRREVLPHVPDAWIDESKTKIGYEIPLNRHFYRYEPPRPLDVIEKDIKRLESDILDLLKQVTS
jgi:type I restriction enzyme M protein